MMLARLPAMASGEEWLASGFGGGYEEGIKLILKGGWKKII